MERWSWSKIIMSQKSNSAESNLSDEQTLEGYTLRFRKNIFRPKYADVQQVQSYRMYR